MAAMGSWLAEGIDVTICRHGALNKRATNKSSARNRATNENGSGRGGAKSGEKAGVQSTFVEWIRMLSRLVGSANLSAELKEDRPLFNI